MKPVIFLVALISGSDPVKLAAYDNLPECERSIQWMLEHKTAETAELACQ